MQRESTKPFLTAHWGNLVMLNYSIDPVLLQPYVPAATELDAWKDTTYVSMVGFYFGNTRVLGVPIPLHRNFEEVNLRFYVKREVDGELRRGVVFIKEIVPRFMISWVARHVYNEPYVTFPMNHIWTEGDGYQRFEYSWRSDQRRDMLSATVSGAPQALDPDSEAEFITEHYWGYTPQRDGGTMEYQVEHPPWKVWQADDTVFDCDVAALYGETFADGLRADPVSAFVAVGSDVAVYPGVRIR